MIEVNQDLEHRTGLRSEFLYSFLGLEHDRNLIGRDVGPLLTFVHLVGIGDHYAPPAPATPNVAFRGEPFFGGDDA